MLLIEKDSEFQFTIKKSETIFIIFYRKLLNFQTDNTA